MRKAPAFHKIKSFTAACMLICVLPSAVTALPGSPQVVSGTASITNSGNAMTVTNSANTIIDWRSFSIGKGESTRFIQPSTLSSVLNRVTGGEPSKILGTLQSNGRVLLINGNGILFGADSRVDVNGLIASTLDISNQDFLAGRMKFTAGSAVGNIENRGIISATGGGGVYLMAPDINNSGVISAPNGDILLAAGREVLLIDRSAPEIAVVVTAPEYQAVNLGTLLAHAGRIGVYGGIIRHKGIISANSAISEGGRIFLKADSSIELAEGSEITADGTKGGNIVVKVGEGDVIGGTLSARGKLSAQGDGTAGSGGFVETSAKMIDINDASVNTRGGNWLLDPDDVEINSIRTISGATLVTPTTIQNALANNNFTVQTNVAGTTGNGDIFVKGAISWSSQYGLTLSALRDINVNANITATGATGSLTLISGWNGNSANPGSAGQTGNINIDSKLISIKGDFLAEAAGGITINATQSTAPLNSGIEVKNGNGNLTLLARNGPVSISAASGTSTLFARAATVANQGTGSINITGTSINITGGSATTTGSLAGVATTSGDLSITSTGNLTLLGGTKSGAVASITSGGNLAINVTGITMTKGGANATLSAGAGSIHIRTGALAMGTGTSIQASGDVELAPQGTADMCIYSGGVCPGIFSIDPAIFSLITANGVLALGSGSPDSGSNSTLTVKSGTIIPSSVINGSKLTLNGGNVVIESGASIGTAAVTFDKQFDILASRGALVNGGVYLGNGVAPTISLCTANPGIPYCSSVLPSISTCISTPTAPGCSVVLPTLSSCISAPTTAGCSVILPSLSSCTATPTLSGCTAVLPSLTTCTGNPTLSGCLAVLPTLATCLTTPALPGCLSVLPTLTACIANPTQTGCSVVLPTFTECSTTPALSGCSAVLPALASCINAPTLAGCSAVLPSLSTCISAPTMSGCSVVLPTLSSCSTNPSLPGCSVILPSIAVCTALPAELGCAAVLPSLTTCSSSPTLAGCVAVLPTISSCAATPSLPGCQVVLPTVAACIAAPAALGCAAVLPSLTACSESPTLPGCIAVLPSLSSCTASPTQPGCSIILPTLTLCASDPAIPGCSVVQPLLTLSDTLLNDMAFYEMSLQYTNGFITINLSDTRYEQSEQKTDGKEEKSSLTGERKDAKAKKNYCN